MVGQEDLRAVLTRIYSGTAVVLLGAVFLGWMATAGDVRVNAGAIAMTDERLNRYELLARRRQEDISLIKADLREIKVMLERIEKELEERR